MRECYKLTGSNQNAKKYLKLSSLVFLSRSKIYLPFVELWVATRNCPLTPAIGLMRSATCLFGRLSTVATIFSINVVSESRSAISFPSIASIAKIK